MDEEQIMQQEPRENKMEEPKPTIVLPCNIDQMDEEQIMQLESSMKHHSSHRSSTSLEFIRKVSQQGKGPLLISAVCSIQGMRKTQEDAHTVLTQKEKKLKESSPSLEQPEASTTDYPFSFFGVFDGHGGDTASEYVQSNLHNLFAAKIKNSSEPIDYAQCLRESFLQVEEEWLAKVSSSLDSSGTTAAVAVVIDDELIVGNVGDSEIVICTEDTQAHTLSELHHPKKNENEKQRVQDVGGRLFMDRVGHPVFNPSVMSIAVSRAIGDYGYKAKELTMGKNSGLIADPFIDQVTLTTNHRFIIIACDGLWDVMTAQEAADFVMEHYPQTGKGKVTFQKCQEVVDSLVQTAYEKGSTDNITALLVLVHWPEAK
eukprot:CAMPEP_0174251742 /NCGR_PEP_ID=MMETSP0439-20130205/1469_1 /TAXON_ID=0 /ORGANISM="Stereomyxa ramosa, Strain Chinc5" /LENGTH=371 /DNA_ID=CAMNT_0015332141 /DNA_START=1 /DNA_END=1116 /DNA_ORIENTATION=-